jgi:hypothetical protein
MPERQDHGRNIIAKVRINPCAKSFILCVHEVLARINIFRHFRITELETAEVPAALQHAWSGHAKSHVSEVYKKLLKQREWRLRWAEKAGTGFTLPGHQEAAAEVPNGKSGKILEFRRVG